MYLSGVAYHSPLHLPQVRGLATLQGALLWLVGAGGAIVFIEPSPYEIAVILAMVVFFASGLRMRPIFVPLIALLFTINIGYTICAAFMMDNTVISMWIATSWFMAISAVFFAMLLAEDTARRVDLIAKGLVVGALIASLAGILGYFKLVPGMTETLTLYMRARGTFKDPNVLAAFIILPALFCLQDVLTEKFSKALRSGIALGIIAIALLLAFSRAAWGQMIAASAFVVVMMLITAPSGKQRSRIIVLTLAAVAVVAVAVVVLLSLDSVGNLAKERASFNQGYDGGRFGRFGRHVLGFEMALDMPLGIGPLQFIRYFPEHTHNSFLNAFMSGGWISGLAFPVLIILSIALGFRHLMMPVPWRRAYIAIFGGFLGTVGESFIIDVDHWRHFWLMLGAMWGMIAAARLYTAPKNKPSRSPTVAT